MSRENKNLQDEVMEGEVKGKSEISELSFRVKSTNLLF